MDHERKFLEQQIQAAKASYKRLADWTSVKNLHQAEIMSKFGFAIEPISIYEEKLAEIRHHNTPEGQELVAEMELLLNENALADPDPDQWAQVNQFLKEKGVDLGTFRCAKWKIIPAV